MSVWIKNPHVSNTINYQGQDILAGEYFDIPKNKLNLWQSDNDLIKDITTITAIVSKDNTGSGDIADISEALDYLKNKTDSVQKQQMTIGEDVIQTYEEGTDFFITKGTTVNIDILINFKYLAGGFIEVEKHLFPTDNIGIIIIDKDNVLGAGVDYQVSEYLKNVPMRKNGIIEIKSGNRSKPIPAGLYCRLTYLSTGTVDDVVGGITLYGFNDV